MPKTNVEFFLWCQDRHLTSDEAIADLFVMEIEDVSAWRDAATNGETIILDSWVESVTATFDHFIGDDRSPECVSKIPRTKDKFFEWCHARGLTQTAAIASAFRLSDQTVRNWERHVADKTKLELDYGILLAIECFDHYIGDDLAADCFSRVPRFPAVTFSTLKKWQNRHDLKTYQDTGDIFRIKRQAVHNWLMRGRIPTWLALACEAINLRRTGKSRKSAK